jgi:uncharacterized membrane protein
LSVSPADGALHRLFRGGLVLKGLFAVGETASGLALWATGGRLPAFVTWLTALEIAEDPTDPLALMARELVAAITPDAQHFYAVYLLAHGVVKLALVWALARGAHWSYPFALVVFAGFIGYQMFEWTRTGSVMLVALSLFDLVMCALVLREWRAAVAELRA